MASDPPIDYVYVPAFPFVVYDRAFTEREDCPYVPHNPGLDSTDEESAEYGEACRAREDWEHRGGRLEVAVAAIIKVEGKLSFPKVTRVAPNTYITDPAKDLGTLTAFFDFSRAHHVAGGRGVDDFTAAAYPLREDECPWRVKEHRVVIDGESYEVMHALFEHKEHKGRERVHSSLNHYPKYPEWTVTSSLGMMHTAKQIALAAPDDVRVQEMVSAVRAAVEKKPQPKK